MCIRFVATQIPIIDSEFPYDLDGFTMNLMNRDLDYRRRREIQLWSFQNFCILYDGFDLLDFHQNETQKYPLFVIPHSFPLWSIDQQKLIWKEKFQTQVSHQQKW